MHIYAKRPVKMKVLSTNNGFTLIEILIAIVSITVASQGVACLTAGIIRGNTFSKQLTTATTLAQDRLEHLKRVGYANAGTMAVTENYGDIPNFSGYKRVTEVVNPLNLPNTRIITVEVSGYGFGYEDKKLIILKTILAE
jgi:type IV pilus assembly protein PilV